MRRKAALTAVIMMMGMVSCSHNQSRSTSPPMTSDPTAEIRRLDQSLTRAKLKGIDVYSPVNYSKSVLALREARDRWTDNKSAESILEKVAEGNTYLLRSQETAEVSVASLGDVERARRGAILAGAPQRSPEEFETAERELIDVTRKIEKGNVKSATEKKTELEAKYRSLQRSSLADARAFRHMHPHRQG